MDEAEQYFGSSAERAAKYNGKKVKWWLRTPGAGTCISCVKKNGDINAHGELFDNFLSKCGVRPALWVDLDASIAEEFAKLTPEGKITRAIKAGNNREVMALSRQYRFGFGGHQWRVLDVQDGKLLLITDEIPEKRAFHDGEEATWESCSLRKYLNDDFYKSFDKADRAKIAEVTNTTSKEETKDKIFLLSKEEAEKYFATEDERTAKYAGKNENWLLRSPYICGPACLGGPSSHADPAGHGRRGNPHYRWRAREDHANAEGGQSENEFHPHAAGGIGSAAARYKRRPAEGENRKAGRSCTL